MSELFNQRLKYKNEKPALANVIKLILNSAYGKTLLRASNTQTVIIKKETYKKGEDSWVINNPDNIGKYIYEHFNSIISYRQINENNYMIEQACIDKSYNRAHIGCFILSQSKHIMNRLLNVFNDLECPVYYTDTDSIHCNNNEIIAVAEEYKNRYNRELIGKQLGEFHGDFDAGDYKNVTSRLFIPLGKKSYVDILQSDSKDIDMYHARMKGVTKEGLQHAIECIQENTDKSEIDSVIELYTNLSNDKTHRFLLNPKLKSGKKKMLLDFNKGSIVTKRLFYREVSF
jgi:uncharacterized protein YegP (UPF0339 family)